MREIPRYRLVVIGVFCAVILLFFGLELLERARYRQTLQTETIDLLSDIRARLENEIHSNFYLTRGLIAYISTNPKADENTLKRLCAQILKHKNYVRNIALAPGNVVRFVYPLKGNEQAIGLDYSKIPEQWPAVSRMMENHKTVIAGPVKLVQGGVGFVSRTPVYIAADSSNGTTVEEEYWGLASIVIEKDALFAAAGFTTNTSGISIAIRGKDGLGEEGEVIDGDPSIFQNDPVLLPVNLPEGSWQLAAIPVAGWNSPSPNLIYLRGLGLGTAVLLSIFSFMWLQKQEKIHLNLKMAWHEADAARRDLRQHEEFLNTVIDNLPSMVFVKDAADLRFLRMNKTGAELLGIDMQEFLGKNDFDFFPESEARFFTEKDREVFASGRLVDIPEEPVQTRNNGRQWLHTRKIPVYDTEGSPKYLLGIAENITEQLAARQDKEKLEKRLHQAQKLETIGRMAAGVAHDLNNILSGIINYPELLLLKLPSDSPIKKTLEDIRDAGWRAANVVSDLLTIARGVAAVRKNSNLLELVDEHLNSPEHLKFLASFPRVYIEVQIAETLWPVLCTPAHIRKCLMNLINNAAEAFDNEADGTIIISGKNVDLQSAITGFADIEFGRYVVLSVRDNGKGIPLNDLEHIFEPFYTKKEMGRSGTGLGLTVVWNTMQDHRGAITVESSPNGTTFSLYLPAAKEAASAEPEGPDLRDLYGRGQTVLVVDDEPHQRDIAKKILEHLGYRVMTASSGEEAILLLDKESADLIVLDMIMAPGINGCETYETIIAKKPQQKAIIASGFAETGAVTRIQSLGAGKYVKKPYTLVELGVAVKEALAS